jgi:hypothetical protein
MKLFLRLLGLIGLLVPALRAEDGSGKSLSGKLSFEIKNLQELYIWHTDKPDNKVLVYKEEGVGVQSALISPDDVWIAVERGGSSLGHSVVFFKREKGLDFKPFRAGQNEPDSADKVGAFALQTKGIKENILDHSYLHPVKWSENSMWLEVSLGANGKYQGKITRVTDWHCRYNPVSHAIQPLKDNPGKIEIGAAE